MDEEIIDIDFTQINEVINKIITTIENKIKREQFFDEKYIQTGLRLLFKMAEVNYQGILYLCEESEKDKTILYLNCPPLNRALFDNLFQTILLFNDVQRFKEFFLKIRLREAMEINAIREKEYGKDEKANEHILDLINIIEEDFKLTKEEKTDFTELTKHISTNQVTNEFKAKKLPIAPFLVYLRDLYYLNLSQFSHSQPTAFVSFFHHIENSTEEKANEFINNERLTAFNFLICFLSEIEINLDLGLKEDISILWSLINKESPDTKKLFELRYNEFFDEIPILT